MAYAKQLHGKELSYINLLDADGALSAVNEFSDPAACIVKHTTPCGCAAAADLPTAFRRAFDGDPLAAFGGIVALNKTGRSGDRPGPSPGLINLLEVIVAPAFAERCTGAVAGAVEERPAAGGGASWVSSILQKSMLHKIVGGYLVQQRDLTGLNEIGLEDRVEAATD